VGGLVRGIPDVLMVGDLPADADLFIQAVEPLLIDRRSQGNAGLRSTSVPHPIHIVTSARPSKPTWGGERLGSDNSLGELFRYA
jgi:hypothetical protein